MSDQAQAIVPRRVGNRFGDLIDRFRPPFAPQGGVSGGPWLMPALRAYSGLRIPAARAVNAPEPLGRLGPLEVRLARKAADVRRAQKLRYRVFYEEKSALADAATSFARRDIDGFDAICDHLLVVDRSATKATRTGSSAEPVVGTYRLLRQDVAKRHGGFYSANEFDVDALVARHPSLNFLEVGRSCVLAPYRNKRTVELLWHGIWSYVLGNRCDVLFGCASLEGTDPDRLAVALSFLHHFARAPQQWRAHPVRGRHVEMYRLPKSAINPQEAWRALPPLIRGYLRLGAYIGEGAVVDRQFGTTDVLIVLPVSAINARYIEHFGASGHRHAA